MSLKIKKSISFLAYFVFNILVFIVNLLIKAVYTSVFSSYKVSDRDKVEISASNRFDVHMPNTAAV